MKASCSLVEGGGGLRESLSLNKYPGKFPELSNLPVAKRK